MGLDTILDSSQRRTLREGIIHSLKGSGSDLGAWGYVFTFQHDPQHSNTCHDDELTLCFPPPGVGGNPAIVHEINVFLDPRPEDYFNPFNASYVIAMTAQAVREEMTTHPAGWVCIRYIGLESLVPYPSASESLH